MMIGPSFSATRSPRTTYDEEIVEYVDGTRGFKEDLNFDELEEAIELYEHEGKDLEEEEESEDE